MPISSKLIPLAAFILAALVAVVGASFAANVVEDASEINVRQEFDENGFEWAEVEASGLQVILTGTAETEAARFSALSAAGRVVDAARVIDRMDVRATADIAAPKFSVEMLRNEAGISLIGLIPAQTDREAVIADLSGKEPVSDFLETADYDLPRNWEPAFDFALDALALLPRSKISVRAGEVEVTAISDSADQKTSWESELTRKLPRGVDLALDISAPRPVITPFTLRFVIDDAGARFDACSAHTETGRARILTAARSAGLRDGADCTLGLGVPSPQWSEAVATGIAALNEIGSGTLTFSDADVSLIVPAGTSRALFDRVAGDLEADLPEVFSLTAVLPPAAEDAPEGPPELTVTRSPEGQVQIRGRLRDDIARSSTESIARSYFGADAVYMAARLDQTLPEGWSLRVLAGLEAFSVVANGVLRVTPETVEVRGNTGNADASAQIARILSAQLGDGIEYDIDVTYVEALDPLAALPTPEECMARISTITAESKITFEPGSATVDGASRPTLDSIAQVLSNCGDIPIEISGHTDSQGRETMNQQLSQQRAESVLAELRARRIPTTGFTAVGYGEEQPIADNDTAEGREENRRIEFRLIDDHDGHSDLDHEGHSGETDAAQEEAQETDVEGQQTDEPD
ncbi:OmpA-OmpF porin, OOP family [Poseidonocella pacifica]|uniref:OmpA-OmpF porin, OOP family n=1 Tax=Poseidonocella pacifica TaxID=871651 RepID=A0A1I0XGB0_9RHOB|nr:OmpA family protein [Poseidonocella pacifica]SFB00119.1 OmpA-OmpF porin, OOP family [Poseidonocella pacifica]